MPDSRRHLWLLGPSGSGKSTLGPRLAEALHLPWFDTDALVAETAGKPIPEIFHARGEEGFRDLESAVLTKVSTGPAAVISCGGGIILRETNRSRMASRGLRIYLKCNPATLARRLQHAQDRPLLSGGSPQEVLMRQLAQRGPWYEESELIIDVNRLTPDEATAEIRRQLPPSWSR